MKITALRLAAIAILLVAGPAYVSSVCAQGPRAVEDGSAPFNELVLEQIRAMPQAGGYSAGHEATQRLGSAARVAAGGLDVEAERAQPSYCSGATYLVFLKTVQALVRRGTLPAAPDFLAPLLIAGQRDGQGVWGRWNANGPGTARLFHELGLGTNFTDFNAARAGDFMKIFWSDAVGRHEHGHSVVYLGTEPVNGVESVRFWSSNLRVGYSEKTVPRSRIKAAIFSRLMQPANLAKAPALGSKPDPYLASLLTTDSSLAEACRVCGVAPAL